MKSDYSIYPEMAAHGAIFLDKVNPCWHQQVDLDRLNMNDCAWCVLGQLYNSYKTGLDEIGIDCDDDRKFDFGFTVRYGQDVLGMPILDESWTIEILNRRKEQGESS